MMTAGQETKHNLIWHQLDVADRAKIVLALCEGQLAYIHGD
jgi:hypothetical protein